MCKSAAQDFEAQRVHELEAEWDLQKSGPPCGRCRLHSSSSNQLLVPSFWLTTVGQHTFPVAASLPWNSLPSDIQSSPSLPVFCQHISMTLLCLCGLRIATLKKFLIDIDIYQQLPVLDLSTDVSLMHWTPFPQQIPLMMMRPITSMAQSIT